MKINHTEKTLLEPRGAPENKQRPNEQCGFYFSSTIKITDPKTGEVLVHKRCD